MEIDPFFAVTDAVDTNKGQLAGLGTAKVEAKPVKEPETASPELLTTRIKASSENDAPIASSMSRTDTTNSLDTSGHSSVIGNFSLNPTMPPTPQPTVEKPDPVAKPDPISSPTPTYQPNNNAGSVLDVANNEIAKLLQSNKITQSDVSTLQTILRENGSLKEKITKLKLLLSRSAKASKETKNDLDAHKRMLDAAQQEIKLLHTRVENLANRPTHMDLLADFETNFDRAILSMSGVGINAKEGGNYQSGGEDPSSRVHVANSLQSIDRMGDANRGNEDDSNVSSMLLSELSQSKSRVEQLEGLNAALLHRASKLEKTNDKLLSERDSAQLKMNNLQLELRMAKMETENATRAMKEKTASLAEMQLEIDLVTKSAMDANVRAAVGMEAVNSIKTDKAYVEELEAKVVALQEWAVASATAKEIMAERNRDLEKRLEKLMTSITEEADNEMRKLQSSRGSLLNDISVGDRPKSNASIERRLWTKDSSLVIGAGLLQSHVVELGECHIMENETVLLRWKFDITPSDMDIMFSILKGRHEGKRQIRSADAVMKDRLVTSGGGGEVQGAFAVQNACTLVWSNEHSWVRPRSIKYTVEAFAVM